MRVAAPAALLCALLCACVRWSGAKVVERTSAKEAVDKTWAVACGSSYAPFRQGCHTTACARHVVDGFVSEEDARRLVGFVDRAVARRPRPGGPTIVDVNSGFVRDWQGLYNMYRGNASERAQFSREEYELYGGTVERIRREIMRRFGLAHLHLTAPTFITRLHGVDGWEPRSAHDEYWHLHVDKRNTAHYDYSGLLYLSTYARDFRGGLFRFKDGDESRIVEPRAGRLSIFTSGDENLHQVMRVRRGQRHVLALWFTCDPERKFASFLDGKVHDRFPRGVGGEQEGQEQRGEGGKEEL